MPTYACVTGNGGVRSNRDNVPKPILPFGVGLGRMLMVNFGELREDVS
jgi:hypothetical protein